LDEISVPIKPDDTEQLKRVALTSLNTKGIFGSQDHFADLAVRAIQQVMEKTEDGIKADIDLVKVMKKHGRSLAETELINGIVIDKEVEHTQMPKNVSSKDMEKLAKATGGTIVGTLKDLSKTSLGQAKQVEEIKIGDDKHVYVREAKNPKAVTIMIRGGSDHVIDEAERSLHDALCVVRNAVEDAKVVAGGGAPTEELSMRLRAYAAKSKGRQQLPVKAFADALES